MSFVVAYSVVIQDLAPLLDKLGEAYGLVDAAGRFRFINAAGAQILGFASADAVFRDVTFGINFLSHTPQWPSLREQADHHGRVRQIIWCHRRNGAPLAVEVAVTATDDGYLILLRDVTQQEELAALLAERTREQLALQRMAATAIETADRKALLPALLRVCMATVEAEAGVIFTYDVAAKQLVLAVTEGLPETLVNDLATIKLGERISGKVAVARMPASIPNLADHPEQEFMAAATEPVHQFASFPLTVRERLLGVLNVLTFGQRSLFPSHFQLLQVLTLQLSLSLENLLRLEELHDRNLELENFNRWAVDRELRMIELKKRIRQLEAALAIKGPLDTSDTSA